MKKSVGTVLCAAVIGASSAMGAPQKPLALYLLIGQSNMAGRGGVEKQDQKEVPGVFALNASNEWEPAVDPIHFDKKQAGVGPGRTFGIEMAEADPTVDIGLIPCAVGGTSIRKWVPGAEDSKTKTHPYDDMLVRLKIAMKSGEVKGILWHQGEADGKMGEQGTYAVALAELIERVRAECGSQDIPFVIGQLGQFEGRPWSPGRAKVDEAQRQVAKTVPHCAFVSSEGLNDRGDLTHFNAVAARELGKRYAQQMIKLQQQEK
ncbi:sialate O-acetylesterase [Pontiellaceae bacterium B12219]|nr:sialate O-acetylesterase [Pontiellaceae bacterium B12219]